MVATKRQPSLTMLLTRYDFSIDFDKPECLVVEETDILLSSHGRIDRLNYLYLLRPAEKDDEWKIYYIKNRVVGYLPNPLTKNTNAIKRIVKAVKPLLN